MPAAGAFMLPHPPMAVPEVGRGSEVSIAETTEAYMRAAREICALSPETIVISSPHSVMYTDYFHISPGAGASGDLSRFGAPEVSFEYPYDTEMVRLITHLCMDAGIPAGTMGERDAALDHGTLIPLYFVRQAYAEAGRSEDFMIVRIGLSGLPLADHYALGMQVKAAADELGRRIVFIASGDLSHKLREDGPYGFAEEGPLYDERVMDVCSRADLGELLAFSEDFLEKSAECGHRSFTIMAGALDRTAVSAQMLSHQDVTGVGYGIIIFRPQGEDPKRALLDIYREREAAAVAGKRALEDPYVRLARASVECFVRSGHRLRLPPPPKRDKKGRVKFFSFNDDPHVRAAKLRGKVRGAGADGSVMSDVFEGVYTAQLPEEMLTGRAGVFVSIHENGMLRGCIGTTGPTETDIAHEIINNAVSACSRDPRFSPVRETELPCLEFSVDVLGEARDAAVDELDPKRYGVIVSNGVRKGLLLPDLEGVDDPLEQVAIARSKAGIREGEDLKIQIFEVVRHH